MSGNQWRTAIVGCFFALSLSWIAFVPPGNAADVTRGKKIYKMMCRKCHGNEGKGDGPKGKSLKKKPANYTKPGFFDEHPDAELKKVVVEGKKPMPSFRKKLKDKDVDDVIAYIKTLADGGK
ncbi:MAG: c-type cytochrome [Candidatus Binatia bacterium]